MPLDRTDPQYRQVEMMLVGHGYSDLREVLDKVVDEADDAEDLRSATAKQIDALPRSSSEKARLRLALWFWNSDLGHLRNDDVLHLDPTNRKRFVDAMASFAGVV